MKTWLIAWISWVFILLITLKILTTINKYLNVFFIEKIIKFLQKIDKAYIHSDVLMNLKKENILKVLSLIIIYGLYLIIFIYISGFFFVYYSIYIKNLKSWEEAKPLKINNISDHLILNLFLVLPNAFSYYILVVLIDIFNKKRLYTPKIVIIALCIRIALGFSIILIEIVNLAINWRLEKGLNGILLGVFRIYLNIIKIYEEVTIIKLDKGFDLHINS